MRVPLSFHSQTAFYRYTLLFKASYILYCRKMVYPDPKIRKVLVKSFSYSEKFWIRGAPWISKSLHMYFNRLYQCKYYIYIKYPFFLFLSSQGKILMLPGPKSHQLSLCTKKCLGVHCFDSQRPTGVIRWFFNIFPLLQFRTRLHGTLGCPFVFISFNWV